MRQHPCGLLVRNDHQRVEQSRGRQRDARVGPEAPCQIWEAAHNALGGKELLYHQARLFCYRLVPLLPRSD